MAAVERLDPTISQFRRHDLANGKADADMATRKSAKKAAAKGRLLSESKVLRVLAAMNVDAQEFQRRYAADTLRGPRTLTPAVVDAVERFAQSGDMEALKKALGTKSDATASKAVARVLADRAKRRG